MYAREQNSSHLNQLARKTLPALLFFGVLLTALSSPEAVATQSYGSNELDSAISYQMPSNAEQLKLNTCFTSGKCNQKADTLVRRYPMRCEGSGNADCTGCYILRNNIPFRTGDLVNGQCPVDATKPQQLRMYVSYRMICPGQVGAGDCDNGELHLNCRLNGIAAQDADRTSIGGYERDCFANGPYVHHALNIPGTSSCTTPPVGSACSDPSQNLANFCPNQIVRDGCAQYCGNGTKTTCSVATTYCPAGFYGPGATCTPCPSGYYNSAAATGATTLATGCQACPASPLGGTANFAAGWTVSSPTIGSTSINNCMLNYSCNSGYTPSSSTNGPWNSSLMPAPDYFPSTCTAAASPSPSPSPSPSGVACNITLTTGAITAQSAPAVFGSVVATATLTSGGSGNVVIIVSQDGAWYPGTTSGGYGAPFPWTTTVQPLYSAVAGSAGWGSGAVSPSGATKTYNQLKSGVWTVSAFDSVDHSCTTSTTITVPGPVNSDRWIFFASGSFTIGNTPNIHNSGASAVRAPVITFKADRAGYYAFNLSKFTGLPAGVWNYSCPGGQAPCVKISGPLNVNFSPWKGPVYDTSDADGNWDTTGTWEMSEFQVWNTVTSAYVPTYRRYNSTVSTVGATSTAFPFFLESGIVVQSANYPASGINDYYSLNAALIRPPCIAVPFNASAANGSLATCP